MFIPYIYNKPEDSDKYEYLVVEYKFNKGFFEYRLGTNDFEEAKIYCEMISSLKHPMILFEKGYLQGVIKI